jgi:cytochrome c-type biogenesis protein CcmE
MKPKHQRLFLITTALLGLGTAAFLMLTAFQDSLVFFYTPSELMAKNILPQQRIRIGGLVEQNSLQQIGENIRFKLTDRKETLEITYFGLLPDLFREGQGVVVEGYLLNPTEFQADVVLAKHDEKYMPREVADRLKQTGLWRDGQ